MLARASATRSWIAMLAVLALTLSLLPATTPSAQADEHDEPVTIALFDFEGETVQPSVAHSAFEVGPVTSARGTIGFVAGNPGRAATTNTWHQDDNYFQFTVTPPDEGVDLTGFSFDEAASGTGPQAWAVSIVDDLDGDLDETTLETGDETGTSSPLSFGSHAIDLTDLEQRTEPFAIRIRGSDASGSGGTWRIDNVTLSGLTDAEVEPVLRLECEAPTTITEGFAAEDGAFVDSKAITATAVDGVGGLDFAVTAVSPDPAPGDVTVTSVDGADAEVRFSDEVPGLDPIDTDGTYTVTITVTDADDQTATCEVSVRVVPVLDIGTLRGVVPDDVDGRQHLSPYALGSQVFQPGDPIAVRGVVTQRTLEEARTGNDFQGFFVQSLDADPATIDGFDAGDPVFADGNEMTSDGLWVSMGQFPTVRTDQEPWEQYRPEPGDIVTLRGPVVESFQQTQMNNPFVVDVVTTDDSGVDLDTHIEVIEVDPPDDVQEASVYWERLAGMQVEVPAESLVVSGNDFFSPSTSEFWVIRGDHQVAQREDPDARRVFRDYHPLANVQVLPEDGPGDQNGFRILLGSFGIKATLADATATITPARSGDTLTEARQGGVFFAFSKYQIMVDEQPELTRGPDPSASSLTAVDGFEPTDEYSVMVYNVENLYDFRSDPFSGCDLDPDVVPDGQQPTSTCTADEPGGSTVRPPFTYAPRSQEAYDDHRIAIAEQILDALDAPDLITIQEAEKQDVCVPVYNEESPVDSSMDCDLSAPADGETMANTDRGSGAPDTVEELALQIFALSDGEVRYEASGDVVHGRDVRGITQGFLHRADRVELVPVEELTDDPVLGAGDAIDIPYPAAEDRTDLAPWVLEAANPKAINAELPQAAKDLAASLGESIDGGRYPQTQYAFSRAAQVGKFRIYPDGVEAGGDYVERYVTSNHMSAGPDGRTAQRTEQARLNAAIAEAARDAGGQVLITGDFNVFPRPDDPFPAFKTDPDREPSDQLAPMYERGFNNLHDVIIEEAPANTYSFIFRGISQILDHIFVDDATLDELVIARYIHVNVDYPAETPGFEPGRGASDHDPLYARFAFPVEEPFDPFTDVRPGDVHARAIYALAAQGILVGFPDGTFRPTADITRGQVASVIARAFDVPRAETGPFSDVTTHAHARAINGLAAEDIMFGYSDGTFRPNEPITRAQLSSVLARMLELDRLDDGPFTDLEGSVHARAINALAAVGIAQGYPDNTFRPDRNVTRAQTATLVDKAMNLE
jgi:hypothetical protein